MSLFNPTWKSVASDKACAAVRKLTDQRELVRAAKEAPDFYARLIAVEALTSQDVLTDVALTEKTAYIRLAAADMLTDRDTAERVYADIALDVGEGVRVSSQAFRVGAVERISNPSLLRELECKIDPRDYKVLDATKRRLDELNEVEENQIQQNNCDCEVRLSHGS
jgi:hypothetical protein